ncbi:MAG: sigma-70 family RNA polymerase sigma factor [Kiritimatiellales bacterium]|nr:sigma-70 family RNA polymerase sigma factor [Kiritimatiellales bacterium]
MAQNESAEREWPSPEAWVDEHGDALFRYALGRLQNPATAEDAVQETFLAAFGSRDRFTGKSSVRTWLIGILKHKIIDMVRKETREQPMQEWIDEHDPADDRFFDRRGHWKTGPADWQVNPSKILQQKEFFAVLHGCLGHLPEKQRRIFAMRELDDQGTEDVCKLFGITSTNLWVVLHRARMGLRNCLEQNWFNTAKGSD